MFEWDYLLLVDGGSRLHGIKNEGYGSYHLATRHDQKQTIRLEFGGGVTNNEAEYRTLITAVKDLVGRIQKARRSPANYSLLVYTDSQLLVGQLTQGWQVKAANLRPLRDQASDLMRAFGRCDLVKIPRDEIVRVLGH